jgi:2,3-bisphosphoglycerate-dependent phosphoglycerate mutase
VFKIEQVVPELEAGKNVLIAAHGNSLRSIIMYLDKLTSQEVASISSSSTLQSFSGTLLLW